MFLHNFKYSFKILLKNKVLVFWSIVWPLILGSLFYMAFSNLSSKEKLDIIDIGIVSNDYYDKDTYLKSTMDDLSDKKNDDRLFHITYGNEVKLNKLLDDGKIDAYILDSNKTNIITKKSGLNQTVVKNVVDSVNEYSSLCKDLIEYQVKEEISMGHIPNGEMIYAKVMKSISSNKEYLNNVSSKNMDYMMIEYYTLLAMACLYGALLSSEVIKNYLGNLNRRGSRVTLSKAHRITLVFSGLLSAFIVQLVTIGVLLLYTRFILHIDYGPQSFLVVLLSIVGSFAGLCLGLFVGAIPFKNESTRLSITNIVVMLGCFFAGMMGVTMKYVIDTNIPIINKLNPANMITDGFYSLYYYENLNRFYGDIVSLVILSSILLIGSCYFLRRKKYDSI